MVIQFGLNTTTKLHLIFFTLYNKLNIIIYNLKISHILFSLFFYNL